ncbi:DUF3397 family protein [Aciduricibacillus chroicocephali]|uniref:DUF3397 family protein n=1 Tax=Aciduricibacillus chroicocephali TaxID=3054939 RepID=UPI003D65075F
MNIVFRIIALLIVFPPISTYILFRIVRRPLRNRRRAIHFAAEWTAPLYMIATTFIISGIIRHGMGPWMLVVLIAVFSILLIIHVRKEGELIIGEMVRRFLRGSFIIFFLLYLILGIVSILMYIF